MALTIRLLWRIGLISGLISVLTCGGEPNPSWAVALQTIRDRGFLTVGIKTNLFPMGFRDESGKLVGFEVDLAQQLSQDLLGQSHAVRFIPVSHADRLLAVASGRVDIAIASITATDSRRRWVDFTTPYYFERSAIAVQQDHIQTLRDLEGASVAVLKGSSSIESLDQDGWPVQRVEVDSYREGMAQLQSGQVQALVGDRVMLLGLMQQAKSVRLLREEFGLYPMAIAMPKGLESSSLRSGINQAIDRLQRNGWLRSQWLRWNLDL